MATKQELSDLMGTCSMTRTVKSARVEGRGNKVQGVVELEGDSNVPCVSDVTMDLVSAVDALEQDNLYADWMATEETGENTTMVFNKLDNRALYNLNSKGLEVFIQPTSEKIGDYSAAKVLRAYIANLSK